MVCSEFGSTLGPCDVLWCLEGSAACGPRWSLPVGRCWAARFPSWGDPSYPAEYPCEGGWTGAREDSASVALAMLAVPEGP